MYVSFIYGRDKIEAVTTVKLITSRNPFMTLNVFQLSLWSVNITDTDNIMALLFIFADNMAQG